jgi:hypothetical protein
MNWKRLLAHISGSLDQELLLRNEYLVTENRNLRNQINGRLHPTDPERISLAEIGSRLGRKTLAKVAQVVRHPTTPNRALERFMANRPKRQNSSSETCSYRLQTGR